MITVASYSLSEAALMSGTTPAQLRVWSDRYGWPSPTRSRCGYRRFTDREVELMRRVVATIRGGRHPRDVIVDGQSRVAPVVTPVPPADLDLGSLNAPRTRAGDEARALLIRALIQRHPGQVRLALLLRDRLPPHDREHCVDGVLRLAYTQLPDTRWLSPCLEPTHVF